MQNSQVKINKTKDLEEELFVDALKIEEELNNNLQVRIFQAGRSFSSLIKFTLIELVFFSYFFLFSKEQINLIILFFTCIQVSLSFSIIDLFAYFIFSNKNLLKDAEEKKIRHGMNNEQIIERDRSLILTKYYSQSLVQGEKIFSFGIFLALIGLGVIPAMIYLNTKDTTLAVIQAILTSFVLVIFQLMYKGTNDLTLIFYNGLLESYNKNNKNK